MVVTTLKIPLINTGTMGLVLLSGGSLGQLVGTKNFSLPPWAVTVCLVYGFLFLFCFLLQSIHRLIQEIKNDAIKNQSLLVKIADKKQKQLPKAKDKKESVQTIKIKQTN